LDHIPLVLHNLAHNLDHKFDLLVDKKDLPDKKGLPDKFGLPDMFVLQVLSPVQALVLALALVLVQAVFFGGGAFGAGVEVFITGAGLGFDPIERLAIAGALSYDIVRGAGVFSVD